MKNREYESISDDAIVIALRKLRDKAIDSKKEKNEDGKDLNAVELKYIDDQIKDFDNAIDFFSEKSEEPKTTGKYTIPSKYLKEVILMGINGSKDLMGVASNIGLFFTHNKCKYFSKEHGEKIQAIYDRPGFTMAVHGCGFSSSEIMPLRECLGEAGGLRVSRATSERDVSSLFTTMVIQDFEGNSKPTSFIEMIGYSYRLLGLTIVASIPTTKLEEEESLLIPDKQPIGPSKKYVLPKEYLAGCFSPDEVYAGKDAFYSFEGLGPTQPIK